MSIVDFDGVTAPKLTVLAGFGGTADPGPDYLHLGVGPGLGTGQLGGTTFVDISHDVISISGNRRGRDSEVDAAPAGTPVITLDNTSGDYDPTNLDSPHWGANQLTTNQYGLEDGTTDGWAAGQDTTIANTTAQAWEGTHALQLTKTVSTGTLFANTPTGSDGLAFPPSTAIRVCVRFRAATTGRTCRAKLAFYDLAGQYFAADLFSDDVTDTTTGWVTAELRGITPELTSTLALEVQVVNGTVGEVHYVDGSVIQPHGVEVGLPVAVHAEWPLGTVHSRFYGLVADPSLDLGYEPTATWTCADGLETLGRARLGMSAPTYDLDTTGERIGHLADEAGWPTSLRALEAGYTTLGPTTLGDSALALARKVESTEFGLLFVDGRGWLVFYDRHHAATASRSTTVQAAFTDTDGAGEVEMGTLSLARSRERTYNDWHLTREPGVGGEDIPVEQTATDLASVVRHGTLSGPTDVGQLHRDDYQVAAMAQYLVGRFRHPQTRIREIRVSALTQDRWDELLPLGPLDRISVSRDYVANVVTRELLIQAIQEDIVLRPVPSWEFTLTTSPPVPPPSLWVLGSSALGSGQLGW